MQGLGRHPRITGRHGRLGETQYLPQHFSDWNQVLFEPYPACWPLRLNRLLRRCGCQRSRSQDLSRNPGKRSSVPCYRVVHFTIKRKTVQAAFYSRSSNVKRNQWIGVQRIKNTIVSSQDKSSSRRIDSNLFRLFLKTLSV